MKEYPIYPNKDQVYTLRMDKELSEQFKRLAQQKNMKPSRLIRELIRSELKKDLPPPPSRPVGRPRKTSRDLEDDMREVSKESRAYAFMKKMQAMQRQYEMHLAEMNQVIGAYVIAEHEKGNLDVELSKHIEKMIDDL